MNILKKLIISSLVVLVLFYLSCIDSKYDLDNINTEIILKIPPVPLGSYDPILLSDLDFIVGEIEIPGEIPSLTFQFQDTIRNLFGSDVVKDFFHAHMQRDLSIEGDLDVNILKDSNLKIALEFNVLDSDYNIKDSIHIAGIEIVKQGEQKLAIVFPKEDGALMYDSQHLLLKIIITTPNHIVVHKTDYLKLSNLIIKTAGYYTDL